MLSLGSTRSEVLDGFISSAEFVQLAASYGIKASRGMAPARKKSQTLGVERISQDAMPVPIMPMASLLIMAGGLLVFGIFKLRK